MPPSTTPGLTMHVAQDLDDLADAMAHIVAHPVGDILDSDWVVIPSAPVRQWLDWRLATRVGTTSSERLDGITANLTYLFPEEFVSGLEELVLDDLGESRATWSVDAMTLRLLAESAESTTLERARRLAQEIDELVRWRPDVVRGDAVGVPGAKEAVQTCLSWGEHGPLAQRDRILRHLTDTSPGTLPARIVLYGLANVPGGPEFARFVGALARHVEIHVLLPASNVPRVAAHIASPRVPPSAFLSGWFREIDETVAIWRDVAPHLAQWDFIEPSTLPPESSLGALQGVLRGNAPVIREPDGTVRVVGAPGLSRQVEVVRDEILAALSQGVGAHEVLIVTTDPSSLAPALERHFGSGLTSATLTPSLPFEMTEVDAANARDAVSCSRSLLDLLASDATAEAVFGLLEFPAVRSRLGLSDSEVDRLNELAILANVTFGVSPAHRAPWRIYGDVPTLRPDAGTWQRFVDRVAASAIDVAHAVDESVVDEPALALGTDDDLDIAASLSPLLRLMEDTSELARSGSQPLSSWLAALSEWMQIVAHPGADDSFDRAAGRLATLMDATGVHYDPLLAAHDFAALWADLAGSRSAQRIFGRRGVNVTRLTSLAFAPYRMVCLVGFDESLLPPAPLRSALLGARRDGDPDARHAVLASTLAAITSATERLVVTWSDRREDDGRPLDAAVVMEELVDLASSLSTTHDLPRYSASRHGFAVAEATSATAITTTYDARYITTDAVSPPESPPRNESPTVSLEIDDLRSFLAGPVSWYLRHTLGADEAPRARQRAIVPPVTLAVGARIGLQRRYIETLAPLVQAHLEAAPTLLAFPGTEHDPTPACVDHPCGWFHEPAARVAQRLFTSERLNANVPPSLWRHALALPVANLAAYNLALDRIDLRPLDRSSLGGGLPDLALAAKVVSLASWRRPSATAQLFEDVAHPGSVRLVHWESREGGLGEWRRFLVAVLDLLVLTASGCDDVEATCSFMPNRSTPYDKKTGLFLRGEYPSNPRVRVRHVGGPAGARDAIASAVELMTSSDEPPALFVRTSVAEVAGGRAGRPATTWESSTRHVGEDAQLGHRLFFPLPYDELARDATGELVHSQLVRRFLGDIVVHQAPQHKRLSRARALGDPARWGHVDLDDGDFVALLEESPS